MRLKYFYDDNLAQASYLAGCAQTGEALVIDPTRNIDQYLNAAKQEGLRITHVTETHIHADFVSGGRELAAAAGAMLFLSDMGDADWKYAFAHEPNVILVREGDNWMVGNVRIEVLHTPGHTPEHIAFLLTDTAGADRPMGVFTGDFLFVGDVGRPDLLEQAAGVAGSAQAGARRQFRSVARFKAMPDYLQIWPGHGAGSACGKALGAIPSTTLGYEKLFNPAFQIEDEAAFVEWLLDGQPEVPRYFAQMKRVNKEGPVLQATLPQPARLDKTALEAALAAQDLIVDLRSAQEYARSGLEGTINIPAGDNSFLTYVGWFVNYEKPLYLVMPSLEGAAEWLAALRLIGVDHIAGYFGPDIVPGDGAILPAITARELAQRAPHSRCADCALEDRVLIIDVRGRAEYLQEHIAGARNIPLGYLPAHLDQIPRDRMVIVQCAGGYRSSIAASLLRAGGFGNVLNLTDGVETWSTELETLSGQSSG